MLYPQLTEQCRLHNGLERYICRIHKWLAKSRIFLRVSGLCPHSVDHITANQRFILANICPVTITQLALSVTHWPLFLPNTLSFIMLHLLWGYLAPDASLKYCHFSCPKDGCIIPPAPGRLFNPLKLTMIFHASTHFSRGRVRSCHSVFRMLFKPQSSEGRGALI